MNAHRSPVHRLTWHALLLLAATVPLIAQPVPPERAQKLQQLFPQLQKPLEALSSQGFVVDRSIRRNTASDDIEAKIDAKRAERLGAEATQVTKKNAVDKNRTLLETRQKELDKALADEVDAQTNVNRESAHPQQMPVDPNVVLQIHKDLEQATAARQKAETAVAKQKALLEQAIADAKAANEAVGVAVQKERDALGEREAFIENLIRTKPNEGASLVQRATIIVRFRPNASADDIRNVLTAEGLEVRSGIVSIGMLVTTLSGTAANDQNEVDRLQSKVKDLIEKHQDLVLTAFLDAPLNATFVPEPSSDVPEWDWRHDSEATKPALAMNLPSAWNFLDAMKRRSNGHAKVNVLVIDDGFRKRLDDLEFDDVCSPAVSDHGNHVLGSIGAKHDGQGIDGYTPLVNLTACAPDQPLLAANAAPAEIIRVDALWFSNAAIALDALINSRQIKVVNASIGYNWKQIGLVPENQPLILARVSEQGSAIRDIMAQYPEVIVSSAAGNDCKAGGNCTQSARWTSPFNWAALADQSADARHLPPSDNIFVVEATDSNKKRVFRSNIDATIAAPGQLIFSTLAADGSYGRKNGTSMAAAAVTGVVALMYSYNPALKVSDIRRILDVRSISELGSKPARVPDAFAALAASRSVDEVVLDLADRNGDGVVDMKDFTQFQKDLKDFNDAVANGTLTAARFSRGDYNGNGMVSATDKVHIERLGDVSDLDILKHLWSDPVIAVTQLDDLLKSSVAIAAAAPAGQQ